MDSKLNRVLKNLPGGTVAAQSWLERLGVYRQLSRRYLTEGWLEKLGYGAYIRSGDTVDWIGGVYTMQEQLALRVHIAADTALQLKGLGHYLPMGEAQAVQLFGVPGGSLPGWFTNHSWGVRVQFHSPRLFYGGGDVGYTTFRHERFSVQISAPERAILEQIYLAVDNPSLEYTYELMTGLSNLRPAEVQTLLNACRSVRVKRYFLWSAESSGHAWFRHLDLTKVNLGSGKRQLFKGGEYDPGYQITVPPVKEVLPDV